MDKPTIVLGGRSEKEIEIFGGEVIVSLNGRVVGTLQNSDVMLEAEEGTHAIKMSKSHDYGSQIGIATENVTIKAGEKLLLRYTPPLLVNAPGIILVSEYDGKNLSERIMEGQDREIEKSISINEEKRAKVQQQNSTYSVIWIIVILVIAVMGIVEVAVIQNN
jgi:hypothetical protein